MEVSRWTIVAPHSPSQKPAASSLVGSVFAAWKLGCPGSQAYTAVAFVSEEADGTNFYMPLTVVLQCRESLYVHDRELTTVLSIEGEA